MYTYVWIAPWGKWEIITHKLPPMSYIHIWVHLIFTKIKTKCEGFMFNYELIWYLLHCKTYKKFHNITISTNISTVNKPMSFSTIATTPNRREINTLIDEKPIRCCKKSGLPTQQIILATFVYFWRDVDQYLETRKPKKLNVHICRDVLQEVKDNPQLTTLVVTCCFG